MRQLRWKRRRARIRAGMKAPLYTKEDARVALSKRERQRMLELCREQVVEELPSNADGPPSQELQGEVASLAGCNQDGEPNDRCDDDARYDRDVTPIIM